MRSSKPVIKNDTLDLHGVRHAEVSRKIDLFLNETIDSDNDFLYIVTGFSKEMQDITIDTISDYNLDYEIGDPWNHGYIKINLL